MNPFATSNKLKEAGVESVWDERPEKLLGLVTGVDMGEGEGHTYTCQVSKKKAGKKKTQDWEKYKNSNDQWPQFFFAVPDNCDLELAIKDRTGGVTGFYEIKISELSVDKVIAGDFSIQVEKKKKKKGEDDAPPGKVSLRLYYSKLPETRPPGPGPHSYSYHEYLSKFKTGDLIVYSGTGILGAVSQLMTNSPYSHVGLVVQLPNKWTTEDDLYVVELTKNHNRFQDAFREVADSGVNIFRLRERIHHYHGNSNIWWVPLKQPIVHVQEMVDWIWKIHRGDETIEPQLQIAGSRMTDFLAARFKLVLNFQAMLDFYSPAFVYKALGHAGVFEDDLQQKYPEGLFANDLVQSPSFGTPVQIRRPAVEQLSRSSSGDIVLRTKTGSSGSIEAIPLVGVAGPQRTPSMDGMLTPGRGGMVPRGGRASVGPNGGVDPRAMHKPPPQLAPPPTGRGGSPQRSGAPGAVPPPTPGNRGRPQLASANSAPGPRVRPGTISTPGGRGAPPPPLGVPPPVPVKTLPPNLALPPPVPMRDPVDGGVYLPPRSVPPPPITTAQERREKMMNMSKKFGVSRLAIKSMGIEEEFNEEKPENAIDAIVARMRDHNTGIPIADINWQGENYTKCFLGCDAVDWMVKTKVSSDRLQAVELANEILVAGKLYHISRRLAFIDGMELYKFEVDEDKPSLATDKIPRVFQVPLDDIMKRQRQVAPDASVPKIMEVLIDAMTNLRASETEGIFRVPTSLTELEHLRNQFNSGDYAVAGMRDAHLPACMLKLWLRELSEALIPDYWYNTALYCDTPEQRQALIASLPEANQAVIYRLFELLYTLSKSSSKTKMDIPNLAMVFAPCFLRCPATDPLVVMENLPREGMFVHKAFKEYCEMRDQQLSAASE